MALVKCPECGKSISNNADKCPNCGYPMIIDDVMYKDDEIYNWDYDSRSVPATRYSVSAYNAKLAVQKQKKRKKAIAIIISSAVSLILVIGIIVTASVVSSKHKKEDYEAAIRAMNREDYQEAAELFSSLKRYEDAPERAIYCNSVVCCENADYETAYEYLKKIPDYKDTDLLLLQIYCETRLLEGLAKERAGFFNPEALRITDVETFLDAADSTKPAFIVTIAGQNRLGGYTNGYYVFEEDNSTGQYRAIGETPSLDSDKYSLYDDEEAHYLLSIILIDTYEVRDERLPNAVDLNRIMDIVKEDNYTRVKRIDSISFNKYKDLV